MLGVVQTKKEKQNKLNGQLLLLLLLLLVVPGVYGLYCEAALRGSDTVGGREDGGARLRRHHRAGRALRGEGQAQDQLQGAVSSRNSLEKLLARG